MLKTLIVDDEYHVVTHIANLIQQIDICKFSILQTSSSTEALQFISTSRLDLALLDINMPGVNGLQLADKIHNQWPDCHVIFLTAYDMFEYIYNAIQQRNTSYLLKSESDKTLLSTITEHCEVIMQNRIRQSVQSDYEKKEKLILLLQEQRIFRELLVSETSNSLSRWQKHNIMDFRFSFEKEFYLVLMHIKKIPSQHYDPIFLFDKMDHMLGNLFQFSFVESKSNMLLWFFQKKHSVDEVISSFDCLRDSMDEFLFLCSDLKHYVLSIYLYPNEIAWNELQQTFQQMHSFYHTETELLSTERSIAKVMTKQTDDISYAPMVTIDNQLSSLHDTLYQGDREQFISILSTCHKYCNERNNMLNIEAVHVYLSIVMIYLDYINHNKIEQKICSRIALYPLYHLERFNNWDTAFSYLNKLAIIIFEFISEQNDSKTRELIARIQKYIRNHLDKNLNLTAIANYVNYNESHVSRLFKRQTGTNLSEYITQCRIDAAKDLLPICHHQN